MYRVYLRDVHGRVPLETKTNTTNSAVAAEAFAALVNRTDLDGQKWAAVFSYDNRQRAFHRFDRYPGQADYWRDRLDEIEWPDERPVVHGGSREGAGRPAKTTDGGPLYRKTVTLDEETITALRALGDGELSEGIRRAALLVEKMNSSSVSSAEERRATGDDRPPDFRQARRQSAPGEERRPVSAEDLGQGHGR